MDGEISLFDEVRRREEQRKLAAQQAGPGQAPGGNWQEKTAGAGGEGGAEPEKGEINTVAYGYYRGIHERASHIEFQRLKESWPAPGYAR